ncbi:hypothetical protein [Flavobacterium sp.]|uniref:hypothetical protein n=1 Tax=Flavobacterium sp. TaxID=239 RepID=UPI00286D6E0B|nr:hypothetical protein [Flavobacterium sp.]
MKNILILLLFTTSLLAQLKPIEVTLNSITHDDSNPKKRTYFITYQIENKTNNAISFFLTPNTLIANAASSMTLFPIYKIYINSEFTPLDGPFFEKYGIDWESFLKKNEGLDKKSLQKLAEETLADYKKANQVIIDNYKNNGGVITEDHWILENDNLMKSKINLNPNEIKTLVIKTSWNKDRYFKQDDLEYYLDEKDKYEFELILDLKKTAFKSQLSNDEFDTIEKDKNFIEGIFTSNRIEINFK